MSSSSELPHGWTQEIDQASGKAYYIHDATQWTTFTRPVGLTSIPSPFLDSLPPQASTSSTSNVPTSPPPPYHTLSPREHNSRRATTNVSQPAGISKQTERTTHTSSTPRMPSLPTFLPLHAPMPVQPTSTQRRSSVTFADTERPVVSSPTASASRLSASPPLTDSWLRSAAAAQTPRPTSPKPIRGILRRSSSGSVDHEEQDDDMMRTISDQLDNVRLYGHARPSSVHPTSIRSPSPKTSSFSIQPRRFSSGSNEPVVVEEDEDSDLDNASVFSFDTDVMAARLRGQALADQEASRIDREEDDAMRIREAMHNEESRSIRKWEKARLKMREAESRREEELSREAALIKEERAIKGKERARYTNAIRKEELRRAEESSIMSELGDLSDFEFLKLKLELARDGLLDPASVRPSFSHSSVSAIPPLSLDPYPSSSFGIYDFPHGSPSSSSGFSLPHWRRSSLSSFSSSSSYHYQSEYPYYLTSSSLPSSMSGDFFPTSGFSPSFASGSDRYSYPSYYGGIQDPGPLDYI